MTDAQIKHVVRKLQNMQTMQEQVAKDEERQKEKPKKDLIIVIKNTELLKVRDDFYRLVFHASKSRHNNRGTTEDFDTFP